ncbi:MAG: LysR family transcriptional regulator [Thalassobaculum sp.]|uniref:LysR family transcriptional regulator n=1 Tax=Thalassobaculum sp. TaxID=2022740 RepID=UPI0032EDB10A
MDRLDGMRVFVAVAESGGFAPAARSLRVSPPAVTRAVAALEERIGARLLHRTTRTVRLTEAGVRFLADAKRILAELDEAEATAAGAHADPRGLVTVTAPLLFGKMHVAPVVLDFLARYPEVSARTLFADRVVDLLDEGVDVAVRIAVLPDSTLSAVRVGHVRRVVCASPGFLARHGTPETPRDLEGLDCIGFQSGATPAPWVFPARAGGGGGETVRPPMRLLVNNADVAVEAAIAGRGITRVLSYQAAEAVRDGRLVVLLPAFEPPPIPVQIVHLEGRRAAARVRAFVDFAAERLRAVLGAG